MLKTTQLHEMQDCMHGNCMQNSWQPYGVGCRNLHYGEDIDTHCINGFFVLDKKVSEVLSQNPHTHNFLYFTLSCYILRSCSSQGGMWIVAGSHAAALPGSLPYFL